MALPEAKQQLFIRRPAAEVFEAFVNPEVTTKFWFTRSTGRLEPGAHVTWHWEMYGVSTEVAVKAIVPNERIVVEWGNHDTKTTVEWTFKAFEAGTYVAIVNSGFQGTPDEVLAQVADATGGFTFVLSGLKAWLEHGIQLNLVGDKFPAEVRSAV
jgi:uncharacterized protein YndB with AHSA1/START domain